MAVYDYLRRFLILPNARLLRTLAQNANNIDDFDFLRRMFQSVEESKRIYSLLIDEVRLEQLQILYIVMILK
jgi:hypothetical protein